MGSINISITEDVYNKLRTLKKEDESFSEVIRNLTMGKDISRCYGILKDSKEGLDAVEMEAAKARKEKWKEAAL